MSHGLMDRRQFHATLAAAGLALAPRAWAQAGYPERPLKLVIPYSPGGPADLMGRFVAAKLGTVLGQTVVIENKPGAGLVVGADYAARSAPDGYTLFLAASSMLIGSGQRGRGPQDNLRDFTCLSLVGSFPLVLVTHPGLPVRNVRELADYVRKRPGDINYGSSGTGSLTHLAGELFDLMAGVKMVHVPYRGINEALTDLVAGRVQLAFAGAPIALSHAKTGKLRALAVTGATRIAPAPELPTVAEDGLPGYDVTPWYGFTAPAATPAPIVARLHQEISRIMQGSEVKERWAQWGADPSFSRTPDEFSALMRAEAAKWARLLKEGQVKLD